MSVLVRRVKRATESLTARLVLTSVLLVSLAAILIGVASYLGMRSFLLSDLDENVIAAAQRAQREATSPSVFAVGNQSPGTLVSFSDPQSGVILGDDADSAIRLKDTTVAALAAYDPGSELHNLDIENYGTYRFAVVNSEAGPVAIGLSRDALDASLASFVGWEFFVSMAAIWAAAGAGMILVMRQLRPLRQVADTAQAATLPLSEGEAEIGSRVPAELAAARTEVGRVGSALNVLLDRVEDALQARRRSEDQVRQFVADASHELRTPLTTIKGYAELARSRPADQAATRLALEKVEQEAGRMATLVEDLLLLARLDAGRALESEIVELPRLLMDAVQDARVLSPEHHWRVDLGDYSPEDLVARGDEQRLHQVVTNLLTNARKYTPAGTTVTVKASPGQIVVHDDGPGFPPELAAIAFERFTRGDSARTRGGTGSEGGAGLGLSLVAAIVAAHGGTVELSSQPGETTFTITLPLI